MRMEVGEPGTTHDCLVRLRGDSFYDQPGDDYANISYNEPFAYSTANLWSTEYQDPQPTLPEEVRALPGSNH